MKDQFMIDDAELDEVAGGTLYSYAFKNLESEIIKKAKDKGYTEATCIKMLKTLYKQNYQIFSSDGSKEDLNQLIAYIEDNY